ncbi:MAG: hypothetical protein JW729_04725 [Bacteroidales bacterium]|nr:hypothetical protein [Bacteroidales bacterium]
MKMYPYLFSSFALIILFSFQTYAQSDCKVLLETISNSYSGGCKNGLANGKGTAKGIDEYTGSFKDGLPHKNGKYTWANGDYYDGSWVMGKKNGKGLFFTAADQKKVRGIWDQDQLKEQSIIQYKVLKANSVKQVQIHKKDLAIPPGTINIRFNIDRNKDFFNTLALEASSGYGMKTMNQVTFNDVTFPFKGKITFVITGKDFVVNKSCIVEFEIYEAGPWTMIITE